MTPTEIIRKLVGPVQPTGQYNADVQRLKNIKVLSGVVLDLLEDVVEAAKNMGRPEASMAAIGKYAADTIGIVNENTGAWDAMEAMRTRAELAEGALSGLVEHIKAMQADAVSYLVPDKTECSAEWFVNRMLWMLDGPKQRAVQGAAEAALAAQGGKEKA